MAPTRSTPHHLRKPDWLRVRRYGGADYHAVKNLLRAADLHTVCESANCPNRGECFGNRTATFLLMGRVCTRACTFCNIQAGRVGALDPQEPQRVAETVRQLNLEFAVVTSVNRDDLPDGGAAHFAATIRAIRRLNPNCGVEVLIPDFHGDPLALQKVLTAAPAVLNHNLETVPELYGVLRPQADYRHSLLLLRRARQWSDAHGGQLKVKTGMMVGVGENASAIGALMTDVAVCGVQILTIGQYLQPTPANHPVSRYYAPAEFSALAAQGRALGIGWVEAGPLVRSSYHAREQADAWTHQPERAAAASSGRIR